MAITSTYLSVALQSSYTAYGLVGSAATPLAQAVSTAIVTFLPTLVAQTVAQGVVGAGVGNGKWVLSPQIGTQILTAHLTAQGVAGASQPALAAGTASGAFDAISAFGQVQTVVTGVAMGVETGAVVACNPSTLTTLLASSMTSFGFEGSAIPGLSAGLANGLCEWFLTGTITGVVTGAVVPPFSASTGVGIGKIL